MSKTDYPNIEEKRLLVPLDGKEMSVKPLFIKDYGMNHLIPLIENWLTDKDFSVTILANRIDGVKKTGFLSSVKVTIFIEDYADRCSVKISGSLGISQELRQWLLTLPPREEPTQKETIIKEQVVLTRCQYCHKLYDESYEKCPNCGASR
jgi:hypothetical protein